MFTNVMLLRSPASSRIGTRAFLSASMLQDKLRLKARAFATTPVASRQVHFHQTPTKGIYAVSFLPEAPSLEDSVTTIGYTKNPGSDMKPYQLQEQPDFMPLTLAKTRGDGYIHIQDERNPPDLNRIGDPADIIASVLVQDSKLVPGSYEGMPAYRTMTGDGVMHLNEELHEFLLDGLYQAKALEEEEE